MKLVQLIEYNKKILSFRDDAKNKAGRLVSNLSLFFKKALNEVKVSGQQLSFNVAYIKDKRYKTLEYWSKDLGINSLYTTFCVWFFKKNVLSCYVMLCSIHWQNLISWLPWLPEILGRMCIANPRLWCHLLCNQPHLSNQAVFLLYRKVRTKIWISWERKELKTDFISFFSDLKVRI